MHEQAKRNYGLKRFIRKLFLSSSKMSMIPGLFRVKIVKRVTDE